MEWFEQFKNKVMKYQFRPYVTMQPTVVTLTGKVYEKGEHTSYTEHKIIEVMDEEGELHYAFEDELISDEVEKQERSYSEEEVNNIFYAICKHSFFEDNVETVYLQDVKDEFEQFKKK